MPDQEPLERFNHYKLWKAETKEFRPVAVSLKGQFDKDGTKNKLRSFGCVANPVHKIFHDKTSVIVNSEAHLLGYVLAEQDEPATPGVVQEPAFGRTRDLDARLAV